MRVRDRRVIDDLAKVARGQNRFLPGTKVRRVSVTVSGDIEKMAHGQW